MEGGIAILLLAILVIVGGGLGIALYLTGGTLRFRREAGDDVREQARPVHKRVGKAQNVNLAGTAAGERAERGEE